MGSNLACAVRHFCLSGLVVVAGCTGAEDLSQPLDAPMVRSGIIDRTFTGLIGDQRFLITFDRNGTATYYGAVAQYVHWRASDQGLCIQWYDVAGEKCAPVYLTGYESYRVGSITMKELGTPRRF